MIWFNLDWSCSAFIRWNKSFLCKELIQNGSCQSLYAGGRRRRSLPVWNDSTIFIIYSINHKYVHYSPLYRGRTVPLCPLYKGRTVPSCSIMSLYMRGGLFHYVPLYEGRTVPLCPLYKERIVPLEVKENNSSAGEWPSTYSLQPVTTKAWRWSV